MITDKSVIPRMSRTPPVQVALEQRRVAEMEALLAGLRASQYRCAVDSQHAGSRAETAEERSLRLQEQARGSQKPDHHCRCRTGRLTDALAVCACVTPSLTRIREFEEAAG